MNAAPHPPQRSFAPGHEQLLSAVPQVAPSILAADFANLEHEIRRVEQAGALVLHLDIMDGHFVPNLSIGVPVVAAVRRITDLPLDVHLMLAEPANYIGAFRDAGADYLSVHIEVAPDPTDLLDEIHQLGAGAGLAINPPTPVESLAPYLHLCDLVLVMSVMPGFGGQSFQRNSLDKLQFVAEHAPNILRSVDGGIKTETIGDCAAAGANLFVCGTGLFGAEDYRARLAQLTEIARNASSP